MSERLIAQHLHLRRHGLAEFGWSTTVAEPPFPDAATMPPATGADQEFWLPPAPSTASRRPPARSRGHCGGSLVDYRENRELLFESHLERNIALVALADRRVLRIWDQPPAVRYCDDAGRAHQHTFDFLLEAVDGTRVAIAVKPSAKVERSRVNQTLAFIRRQAPPGFADHFVLRTERHATPTMVQNAEWILRARRMRDSDQVAAMARFTATMAEPAPMAAVAMRSGLGPGAWNALVCLIDEGFLELPDAGAAIGELALVRPTAVSSSAREAGHA
ncbi:TnsA endonuclease N-terminal domain-containing protein [Nitrospirillum viridazoti]|uniref:TnsA endonuclease-like protein n=1 Tax=Nitrospirillum amazonense TaxID=28077 RepID=A0A560J0E9_9PROT|nr:TnsA endonuclease N-terminal domain-containing protein [Nitrospirillum amazonense]TWB64235.1 TnsA endonuclease-like protein [Nitrospirillum amazonense]